MGVGDKERRNKKTGGNNVPQLDTNKVLFHINITPCMHNLNINGINLLQDAIDWI